MSETADFSLRKDARKPVSDPYPAYTGKVSALWTLPGHGGKAKPNCGIVRYGVRCPDALPAGFQPRLDDFRDGDRPHAARVVHENCKSKGCEICYPHWIRRQALKVEERLERGRELLRAYRRQGGGAIRHWVLSPPPELVADLVARGGDVERTLRKMARDIILRAGLVGGVEIFHPWRTKARGINKYRAGKNFFSPHLHFMGTGFLRDGDAVHKETGWILKNRGVRDSVYKTAEYLLDHAGARDGKQTLSWFGAFSNRKLCAATIATESEQETCECGKHVIACPRAISGEEIDWLAILPEPVMVRKKTRLYWLHGTPVPPAVRNARKPPEPHPASGSSASLAPATE